MTALGKNKNHQCRAIFDTGAQRSFKTEKTASELQPDVIGEKYLNISIFGQPTENEKRKYKMVSLQLLAKNESINISALVPETVCAPIKYNTSKPLELPRNLQLADLTVKKPAPLDVDILIGNDYYQS